MQQPANSAPATQLWFAVFAPFACGYFLSYLYRVVNAVIAPDLVADVGIDAADLGLLTSAYFLTFAAFQLPLGLLLDRFGPSRTEGVLLLVAAAGAWIFAASDSTGGLLLGRALIGFGVSACLMAPFKAFTVWFPPERLPQVNGFQMAAGGLGALSATQPVAWALQFTDWRGVFHGLAVLTLLIALLLYFVVPHQRGETPVGVGLAEQLAGVARVFTSRLFWRIAPWAVATQATFLAILGLWSGPWLRDIAAYDRPAVAALLAAASVAMVGGFIVLGTLAQRVGRRGGRPLLVSELGLGVFMAVQLLIIVGVPALAWPLWLLFGFFGTVGIIPYAVLSQRFPVQLAGRVNTGLNLLVFVAAFAYQWGIGVVIDRWPTVDGHYATAGYRTAFGVLLAVEILTFGWYLFTGRDQVGGRPLLET